MPCIKCGEDSYKWGEDGDCSYSSLEACQSENSTYNAEEPYYDHEYDFTEEEMQELHENGVVYVTQTDEDGTEMTIKFTYKDGEVREHSNFKNLKDMNWYNIKNLSSNSTEVVIYDEIGQWGIDSKAFIDEIKEISTENVLLRIACL